MPFVLATNKPGKRILCPLAFVVLGGILTSTLFNQIVMPVIFYELRKPITDKIMTANDFATKCLSD